MILKAFFRNLPDNKPKACLSVKKDLQKLVSLSPAFNITPRIIDLTDQKLLRIENHPLCIIKERVKQSLGPKFKAFEDFNPIVSVQNNFDVLNIGKNHPSRSKSDTYYVDETTVLRTHTSAHQHELLSSGINDFVVFGIYLIDAGDVYRRDQIDRYHYPVFHQMEAVSMLGDKKDVSIEQAVEDLKKTIEKIVEDLFGKCQKKWVQGFFPFTEPSFELQIYYDGKWVQMLGCGIIHDFVLQKSGRSTLRGWAAGLGLERFAMKLFKIPDVRLFWSKDARFLNQFTRGKITDFKQFSKYPICFKDLSMWVTQEFNANDLFNIIRQVGGDLIETVDQISTYTDPTSGKTSKAYRISFRSLERTLQNQQIVKYQFQIRDEIKAQLKTALLR